MVLPVLRLCVALFCTMLRVLRMNLTLFCIMFLVLRLDVTLVSATELTVAVTPFLDLDGRPAASRLAVFPRRPSSCAELTGTAAVMDVTLSAVPPTVEQAAFTRDLCAINVWFSTAIRVASANDDVTCADIFAPNFVASFGTGT